MRDACEDRGEWLQLLAGLALSLTCFSWPILYLLLQSYIDEWPGLMCVYGVTQIGVGTVGSSRWLLPLLTTSLWLKPLLVAVGGTGFIWSCMNRLAKTAPFTRPIAGVLLLGGVVTIVDAGCETAYLTIPKKEVFVSTGCCVGLGSAIPRRIIRKETFGVHTDVVLTGLFVLSQTVLIGSLIGWSRRRSGNVSEWRYFVLLAIAAINMAFFIVFLTDVASPRLLRMPDHHCLYDLPTSAPRAFGAAVLQLFAAFCVLWGCAVRFLSRACNETTIPISTGFGFFRLASNVYLISSAMLFLELSIV